MSLAESSTVCRFGSVLVIMVASFGYAAGLADSSPKYGRIRRCDVCKLRLPRKTMNQLADEVNCEYTERKPSQESSRFAGIGSHAIQVMAKDIAQSGIKTRIESCAGRLKSHEAEPASSGCPSQGRRYRIQSRDELVEHENRRPILGKGPFRLAIGSNRVWREAVKEVQDPFTLPPTGLIP